jgi:ubiquinone/menaquinone biosynthesis C-methylase UbiE
MQEELTRLAQEYTQRDSQINTNSWKTSIYHPRHSLGQLFAEHNKRILITAINKLDIDLEDKQILDLGCGDGSWLRMLIELGANPLQLTGIDLSPQRIQYAQERNPLINYIHNRVASLPLPSASYDLVMQTVVFSSILDPNLTQHLAKEMERVLKPGGYLIWLDNSQAFPPRLTGYSPEDLKRLFPNLELIYKRRVHPRYFRKLHKNYAWVAQLIYQFTPIWCDALLIILKKGNDRD